MTLDVGSQFAGYEIVSRLRSGGMGALYLARRRGAAGFARHVAIKVIHAHLAEDPTFVRMFVDEARLASHIHDPKVVHVEEFGERDGTYFLVMEYIAGVSLARLMARLDELGQGLPIALAVHVAMEIADALHAAHETVDERGEPLALVHRDVSPHNVLLAERGHVKLVDFGIAKARGREVHTATGAIRGKLSYMAPEQALSRDVDRRTDVYALGIVLWEMLARRRLFTAADDLALLDLVRAPHVVQPSHFAPDVPPSLDAAVLAALEFDPARRPATAQDFRRRLGDALPEALAVDRGEFAALLERVLADDLSHARRLLTASSENAPSATDPSSLTVTPTSVVANPPSHADTPSRGVSASAADDVRRAPSVRAVMLAAAVATGIAAGAFAAVRAVTHADVAPHAAGEPARATTTHASQPAVERVVPTASTADASVAVVDASVASVGRGARPHARSHPGSRAGHVDRTPRYVNGVPLFEHVGH